MLLEMYVEKLRWQEEMQVECRRVVVVMVELQRFMASDTHNARTNRKRGNSRR